MFHKIVWVDKCASAPATLKLPTASTAFDTLLILKARVKLGLACLVFSCPALTLSTGAICSPMALSDDSLVERERLCRLCSSNPYWIEHEHQILFDAYHMNITLEKALTILYIHYNHTCNRCSLCLTVYVQPYTHALLLEVEHVSHLQICKVLQSVTECFSCYTGYLEREVCVCVCVVSSNTLACC